VPSPHPGSFRVIETLTLCSEAGECVATGFFGLCGDAVHIARRGHRFLLGETNLLLYGFDVFFLFFLSG